MKPPTPAPTPTPTSPQPGGALGGIVGHVTNLAKSLSTIKPAPQNTAQPGAMGGAYAASNTPASYGLQQPETPPAPTTPQVDPNQTANPQQTTGIAGGTSSLGQHITNNYFKGDTKAVEEAAKNNLSSKASELAPPEVKQQGPQGIMEWISHIWSNMSFEQKAMLAAGLGIGAIGLVSGNKGMLGGMGPLLGLGGLAAAGYAGYQGYNQGQKALADNSGGLGAGTPNPQDAVNKELAGLAGNAAVKPFLNADNSVNEDAILQAAASSPEKLQAAVAPMSQQARQYLMQQVNNNWKLSLFKPGEKATILKVLSSPPAAAPATEAAPSTGTSPAAAPTHEPNTGREVELPTTASASTATLGGATSPATYEEQAGAVRGTIDNIRKQHAAQEAALKAKETAYGDVRTRFGMLDNRIRAMEGVLKGVPEGAYSAGGQYSPEQLQAMREKLKELKTLRGDSAMTDVYSIDPAQIDAYRQKLYSDRATKLLSGGL